MKKNTKMFQRSLTAFLTAALVTTSFGGQGIVFAKAKKEGFAFCESYSDESGNFYAFAEKGETFS